MAIDRYGLVSSHNPILKEVDKSSPLTVGNGELAFTADVTGMQTLEELYRDQVPLCTMSQWGWHTTPADDQGGVYTLEDLEMTEYSFCQRTVRYPKEKKPGNEAVYDWLRINPHRLNLGRIGLIYDGRGVEPEEIGGIYQELKLYEGILESHFLLRGERCTVRTACSFGEDVLTFEINSPLLNRGHLQVRIDFPYGSADITASDWEFEEGHKTGLIRHEPGEVWLERILDGDGYYVRLQTKPTVSVTLRGHKLVIDGSLEGGNLAFKIGFGVHKDSLENMAMFRQNEPECVFEDGKTQWKSFWETGGIIRLCESKDPRGLELERRMILSQYLMAVNSSGSMPPQETGLTCNSWYGKMHLEMYLWHCAWLPLWNRTEHLERSLCWYLNHLDAARENAARNGYRGARWPKMIGSEGVDAPSPIAPLLVWQQPHIIYMLELAYRKILGGRQEKEYRQHQPSQEFLLRYWHLVEETAIFMADFAVYDENTGTYHLEPPLIPVQERFQPEETRDPAFEVEYWHFALKIAGWWAKRLGKDIPLWEQVSEHMAGLTKKDGLYEAHSRCSTTFSEYQEDHPSMLGALGLIPGNRVDKKVMEVTFDRVLECWDFSSLWGWDFAMMAMTAVRLGRPEKAVDILMKDTLKNSYVASGNNLQKSREDLPLYLPGNGSLLLALALMTAGYEGCKELLPGFPKDGNWTVEYEGIMPFFC